MDKLLLAALCAGFLAGCAANDAPQNADDRVERQYVTGSNIPKKSRPGADTGVTQYDRESFERARDTQYQAPPPTAGKGG
jgi:hypothetical protein